MKKRKIIFVLFLSFVLLSGFVSAGFFSDTFDKMKGTIAGKVVSGCVDSDGGVKPFESGYTYGGTGGGMLDTCLSANYLRESVCLSSGSISSKTIYCEDGCYGGKCNTKEECESEEGCQLDGDYCLDEDEGDFFTKADLYLIKKEWYDNGSDLKLYKGTDGCSGEWVEEYVCKETGEYVRYFTVCPDGCESGACIKGELYEEAQAANCQEGGEEEGSSAIYVKGTVSYAGEIYEDYCVGSSLLKEHRCDNFGLLQAANTGCVYGCEDGACLKRDSSTEKIISSESNLGKEDEENINSKESNASIGADSEGIESDFVQEDEKGSEIVEKNELICEDSDNGEYFSIFGTVTYEGKNYDDKCDSNEDSKIIEYYCESNTGVKATVGICKFGCDEGKCLAEPREDLKANISDSDYLIETCSGFGGIICSNLQECSGAVLDKDLGLVEGETCCVSGSCSKKENYFWGNCNGCILEEECYSYGYIINNYYCSSKFNAFTRAKSEGKACEEDFECLSGNCDLGVCSESKEKDSEVIIECTTGCFFDGKCYNVGSVKSGNYCSEELEFVSLKKEKEECSNNYECFSNFCVEEKCISMNLFQRFLAWFRGDFVKN